MYSVLIIQKELLLQMTCEESAPNYLNFEINAIGAMLACCERDRQNRILFSEQVRKGLSCETYYSSNRINFPYLSA